MKKNWRNRIGLVFVLFMLLLASCKNNKHAENTNTYTCPMHPTVVSDRPGSCPVCGMDLVRKAKQGEEVKVTEDLARLIKSPNEVVVASIKTVKGEFKSLPASLKAQGLVTYDTRYVYTIPARIGGRLERVYLKYVFQQVVKGQKVADIYSPELLTAQRELLYLVEHDRDNQSLIESAKNKLYLLGASEKQIEDIVSKKEAAYTFSIFSSYGGYVISEDQQAPVMAASSVSASSSMGGGMGDSGTTSPSQSVGLSNNSQSRADLIREGNYVTTGQTLFKVVNTSALRVELNLPTSQSGSIKTGDKVDLDLGNGSLVKGKVDFVQPFFTEGEEFLKVRVYLSNGPQPRIGQLVAATIQLKETEALWLPKEAVLDMGLEKIVFVKEREVFKPKKVVTGVCTNGKIEIRQGLSSSDEVAVNAQYLVDSESFIKSK